MSNITFINPFLTPNITYFQHNIIGVMHIRSMVFEVADYESEVKNVEYNLL